MSRYTLVSASGKNHGWRGDGHQQSRSDARTNDYSNFGPPDPTTKRKMLVSRRIKKIKVTLPTLKFMSGKGD